MCVFSDVKKAIDAVLLPESVASPSKSIELGQTPEQAEAILGNPESVAKLGSKMIYSYKTMKVIWADGKVSDVQ